jgi:predicted metal-dependent hydrolase
MKRIRDRMADGGGAAAALQLSLPLFDPPPASTSRGPQGDAPPAPPTVTGTPRATPPANPRGRRIARLAGHPVEYELRRSRRRTIGFYVDDTGLRVTAPRWVTLAEIESALAGKEQWILRKLVEWREHARRRERLAVRWEDGGTVTVLGRELTMRIHADDTAGVACAADTLRVSLPPRADAGQLRDTVHAWLQAQARQVFAERLAIYAERLGRAPTRWRLSSARTRWGSCAPDGSIRLNWRLVHFPLDIVDYVIAHELAHLAEMNHGPRFWATVQALLPGFEAARRQLKDFPDDLTMS